MEKECWICKYYKRPRPILFGLGETAGRCKKLELSKNFNDICDEYVVSRWRVFWDRATKPV